LTPGAAGKPDQIRGLEEESMKARYLLAAVPLWMLALSACTSGYQPGAQTATLANAGCSSAPTGSYKIGQGDVLNISVWNNKNLDRVATVRPDGMISFPLINAVRAAGRTPTQLQKAVTQKLKRYISAPQVSVVVQKIEGSTASVLGEVNQPGSYPMTSGKTTVLDMLAEAGGLTAYADHGGISVLRKGSNNKTRRIHFRYNQAISGHPGAADFCLQPGDQVVVR
jgi:polysaccharide export outer membrane protein